MIDNWKPWPACALSRRAQTSAGWQRDLDQNTDFGIVQNPLFSGEDRLTISYLCSCLISLARSTRARLEGWMI